MPIQAQQVLFYNHIAPVIYKSCMPCHLQGAAAPIALETYDDVKHHAKMIAYVVGEHIMPPWKADVSYCHFYNERTIDSGFLSLFQKWITEGYPAGDRSANAGIGPVKQKEEKPDYIIKMPGPLKLEATNTDVWITYVDSFFPGEGRYMKRITVVPGNVRLVHHVNVDFDTTDRSVKFLNKDGFVNSKDLDLLGPPPYGYVGDYVPGIQPYSYPENIGYKIPSKVYVMVNIHYAPNSREDVDSTKVLIYLYPKGHKARDVEHWTVRVTAGNPGVDISRIPKDSISLFGLSSLPMNKDISIISIQPHMHLLGKTMQVFAVTPANDTLHMIRINDWKFNWQENYRYIKPVVLPRGSVIFCIATFDNTSQNPDNPFYPPQDVYFNYQMKTTSEMYEVSFQSVAYKRNDENLALFK